MIISKLGAIDIGSNAVRLLIYQVIESNGEVHFDKIAIHRAPVRLGKDVFKKGKISKSTAEKLNKTMKAFDLLMDVHCVEKMRACATEAFRSASNAEEVLEYVNKNKSFNIEIIDGQQEAKFISMSPLFDLMDSSKKYLFVDVGGGSTELTLFKNNECVVSRSFPIGTIRLLDSEFSIHKWDDLVGWIATYITPESEDLNVIGSGGNINKIMKLCEKKHPRELLKTDIESIYHQLSTLSVEERMFNMSLKEDRADVIIPAAKIFLTVLEVAQCGHLFVPKIGVADGIIRSLYYE